MNEIIMLGIIYHLLGIGIALLCGWIYFIWCGT